MAVETKPYFPALDSLRFFASLNIVLLHFSTSNLLSYSKGTFYEPLISTPIFSANMFFLLSGFIYAILKVPEFKSFMKSRFWRLYPLHLACTLLIFAITIYRTNLLNDVFYAIKTLALHLSLTWAFVPSQGHQLNQPSWALSVFFLCYLLTPSFSKFLNKQNKKTLWFLFLFTWAILLSSVLYFDKLPNIFRGIFFFSGMLLGKLFINKAFPLPKRAWLNDLFLLLAVILLCINVYCPVKLSYHIISPILYSAFLLLLANNKGFAVKILSVSWLRSLGKISFYVYLLHGVAIELLHLYLSKVANWLYNPFNNPLATLVILIVLYGGCLLRARDR